MGIYDELQKISTDSPTLPPAERQIQDKPAEKVIDETVQIQGSQPTTPKQRKPIKEPVQSTEESVQTSKHASLQAYMQSILDEKATYTFTFRYPPPLLDKLEDIVHFSRMNNRIKLTKNSLAVAALSFLIWEFETKGENSPLYKILIENTK